MRICAIHRMALGIGLAVILSVAWQVEGQEQAVETVSVTKTYNNAPFDYQIRPLSDRAGFRVYRLTYPSPVVTPVEQNNTIPADYYLPDNIQPGLKYPAAICLHILNGDEQLTDLVCSVLASRGVPALSFKLPYYGSRGLPDGPEALTNYPKLFVSAINQVVEDVRRTVDLLASRPEINPERIGITGISLGGITGATAAGAEPRLYRACLLLAGGDLLPMIHHARESRQLSEMIRKLSPEDRAEVEAKLAEVDPLRFAPALRDRAQAGRVLMINAAEDEVLPRQCTEKLAEALGIADRVVWLEGLGHYTALAEMPRALRTTADFFAEDLPDGANRGPAETAAAEPTALERLASVMQQAIAMVTAEPDSGRCHLVDLELSITHGADSTVRAKLQLVRGFEGRFSLRGDVPFLDKIALGQSEYPWMVAGKDTLIVGSKEPAGVDSALAYVKPGHLMKLRAVAGIGGGIVLAPDVLQQWVTVEDDASATGGQAIRLASNEPLKRPGEIRLLFSDDGRTPASATFAVAGLRGEVKFRGWQVNTIAQDELFAPPEGLKRVEVAESDLHRMFAAILNYAAERLEDGPESAIPREDRISVVARDPAGHGLLCRTQNKTILMVSGTPEQMGTAHGTLLGAIMPKMTERTIYLVGAGDTLRSGEWFFDTMAEIERRTLPHIPPRFLEECDAMAKAAGVSQRDGRYTNLFPERFHCSGVALRGKATVGGQVLHARVLDYMCDIDLQNAAVVQVFMPEGRHAWISLGFAGFLGTVTAMNEQGVAIGEMGGGGNGLWDGMPMSLLLRDVMERASTVEQAVDIIRNSPRTCEYYYVISDKSGTIRGLHCVPEEVEVLKPGQQDARLPPVPEDTVMFSAGERAEALSQRLQENHGKISAQKLIDIIKRPVASRSNLHNAVFAPERLDMWFADAGKHTPACDEPYAHVNLGELIQFYGQQNVQPQE